MNAALLNIGAIIFIVYAVFNILWLIDMRRTSVALRRLIGKTEESLGPALAELTRAATDIRKATEGAFQLVERLRIAAGTIISAEKSIESIYHYYRQSVSQSAQSNIAGIKAGVRAGVVNFLSNLKSRKEGSS